ncbi:hypothetical protein DICVIV_09609 [Dictyocaulus viviparus]|uniref:Uncharacterized protein n=1 Tax=Dictyocaulus viviparus TaxID=29172 RepID=A0A0D8XKL8_DICVI|nr:hypothetical protein DICVIV_09609 [Dictyocaulus viviparus]
MPILLAISILMSVDSVNRPPFDQNDRKYKCLCGQFHIRTGSRIVAVFLNIFIAINLIFSLTRTPTVVFYTLMTSVFAVVVFGSLLYGVYKEKRLFLIPYLVLQILSVGVIVAVLLSYIIAIAVNSGMIIELAKDLGNVDIKLPQKQLDAALSSFTVLFIIALCITGLTQAYFFEVIYSFYGFLHDRESSFNFNFEGSPTTGVPSTNIAFATSCDIPPPH